MLVTLKMYRKPGKQLGSHILTYSDPDDPANWIAEPCRFCGSESFSSLCPGDGRFHRHGRVHVCTTKSTNTLIAVCKACRIKVDRSWKVAPVAPEQLLEAPQVVFDE